MITIKQLGNLSIGESHFQPSPGAQLSNILRSTCLCALIKYMSEATDIAKLFPDIFKNVLK